METSFVERLRARAETMLPPATVMRIECAGDASGDPALLSLLDEVEQKGLRGEPLCGEPYRTIVYDDRVLLRCGGCPRMETLPKLAGIGRGADAVQARENALYALTLPMDGSDPPPAGCLAARSWGDGPVEDVQYACVLNRVAYAAYPA